MRGDGEGLFVGWQLVAVVDDEAAGVGADGAVVACGNVDCAGAVFGAAFASQFEYWAGRVLEEAFIAVAGGLLVCENTERPFKTLGR
jgi:hypothetical protein